MTDTTFTDSQTIVVAAWLNEVNAIVWGVFNGATTVVEAQTALGIVIGTQVQAWDTQLDDIAALAVTNGNIIVGNGSNWVAESGATARTSLGVAIGSDVQAYDGTILKDADIGSTVQAYDATNALKADITYEQLNTNGDVGVSGGQLATGNHTHSDLRESLTAARTYYVRVDGLNSNTGLVDSAGGAFLTVQKAIDTVMNTINLNGYDITIDLGNGTYTSPVVVNGSWTGTGTVTLLGDATTPSNVVFSTTGTHALAILNGAVLHYGGFKVQTTTSGSGVIVAWGSTGYQNAKMDFGTCVTNHIDCNFSSSVYITADYNITGDAVIHYNATTAGIEVVGAITVTLTGTPAFTWFAGTTAGIIRALSATYTGAATGARFLVFKNGSIDVGAGTINTFPGDVAGSETGGGTYTYATSTHVTGVYEEIVNSKIEGANAAGPAILNEAAIATNPTLVPNKADLDTGIGWNSTDKGSLVAGGVESANWDANQFSALKILSYGPNIFTADSTTPLALNRSTSDGVLLNLLQDSVSEGSISVSGTTVSYNSFCGAHWSQLADKSKPDILKGTVVEHIDEMCDWDEKDNDQLARFKISGDEGSNRVYGVFSNWDEEGHASIHSLGATLIRVIGSISGGDLLESAGDGTAKAQADDIIRSSTIGKVTVGNTTKGETLVPVTLYCG